MGLERPAECWLVEAEHPEREQGGGTGSRWPPGSCFDSWVGKVPWRRDRLPTPVFWPGELHGLYSPWGRKESGMTERHSKKKVLAGASIMAPGVNNPLAMQETQEAQV